MLVIPLGLGTKLRRAPVVTVLMAGIWILAFALDRSATPVVSGIVDAVATSGLRDSARRLFVDYCLSRQGKRDRCEKYAVLVWTGYPGKAKDDAKGKPRSKIKGEAELTKQMEKLAAEQRQARKVREELDACSEKASCFVYRDIIWRFQAGYRVPQKRFAALASYRTFKSSYLDYRKRLQRICQTYDCLVSTNITTASVIWAQLRHGSLLHLASNLFVFVLFGIYVEQRASRLVYFLTMLVGGSLGLALHAYCFSQGDTLTLGGSANVSAMLGMFFVFFIRQKMRFLVWLPRKLYWGTVFLAPVSYCFPLLFVLSDVTGGFDSGFSDLTPERVAHFAHLGGLAFGLLAAWLVVALRRLPAPFIFDEEPGELQLLASQRDIYQIMQLGELMVARNPENVPAMRIAAARFLAWLSSAHVTEHLELCLRGHRFLAANLQTVCAVYVRAGELDTPFRLLSQVPASLPLAQCLGRLGPLHVLKLGDFAYAKGDNRLALRLYEFYLLRYPKSRKCAAILATAQRVVTPVAPARGVS